LKLDNHDLQPLEHPWRLCAACHIDRAAQQPVQHIRNLTAAQIAASWKDVPPEYGPEPYYVLNGFVSLQQVQRDLDTLHHLGFRAVTVQAGRGMPFAYLSPEYFTFVAKFLAEAKSRNMRIWIVDDAGYPSGFAGGKFTIMDPELRMQAIEIAKRISVAGGTSIREVLPAETVGAAAVDEQGKAIPLMLRNHMLEWTAPAGNWTILIANHEFRTSPTRSDTNPRQVKDTSQSLEDYLAPTATEQYLRFTHEQYKRYVQDWFGRTVLGFRGDEPDYSISGLPWTRVSSTGFKRSKVTTFSLLSHSLHKHLRAGTWAFRST
jgi:hypothetical protein